VPGTVEIESQHEVDTFAAVPDTDMLDMVSDSVGADMAYAATFNGEQDVYYPRIGDYDCNINGVGDQDDIAGGTSFDLNLNGIPDECEVTTILIDGFESGDTGGWSTQVP